MSIKFRALLPFLMLSLINFTVMAQQYDGQVYTSIPTEDEVVRGLKPVHSSKPVKLRGGPEPRSANPTSGVRDFPTVQFRFNDYTLTQTGRDTLDVIGRALNRLELRQYNFIIEGHTDSVGSAKYNQLLSERRAESAKNYLVQRGVDPTRLIAIGKGEKKLLDPQNPKSGINRRVKIITLQ